VPFDRWDERPLYLQVAEALREQITEGKIEPGERLPTEAELADTYGVARETIRQALRKLREEGMIRTYQGRGSYVPPRTGH
jgi:DNA-binding GntR family transcriptional regulator